MLRRNLSAQPQSVPTVPHLNTKSYLEGQGDLVIMEKGMEAIILRKV